MDVDNKFKKSLLKTEKTVFDRFKEIKKILKMVDPSIIEECSLEEIHEMIYNCKDIIYEITPLDKIKIPFKSSDHRNKLESLCKKAKCIYTSKLGAILKSENSVERYYLKGDSIDCELCIFDNKTVINLRTKDLVIKDKEFADLMRLFFNILISKAKKV